MLFPYKYLRHKIERMQLCIDYIFYEVWCKAPNSEYDAELYNGMPRLKSALVYFWQHELAGKPIKGAQFFLDGLNSVFNEFKNLSPGEIASFKAWYSSNNDIERACENQTQVTPVQYEDMETKYPSLSKELNSFFGGLYSHTFLSLEEVQKRIGSLSDHYLKFVELNDEGICPFCGIEKLDGQWDRTRDAYDHYLPKSKYPFNSINFRNLIPTGYACNSKEKGATSPIILKGKSRKAFYPFSSAQYKLEIQVAIQPDDWSKCTPDDITISVGPSQYASEINTWLDVYSIDTRYKAIMCEKNYGKNWITQIYNWSSRNRCVEDYFKDIEDDEASSPYANMNFLKRPFLEGCRQEGIFQTIEDQLGRRNISCWLKNSWLYKVLLSAVRKLQMGF